MLCVIFVGTPVSLAISAAATSWRLPVSLLEPALTNRVGNLPTFANQTSTLAGKSAMSVLDVYEYIRWLVPSIMAMPAKVFGHLYAAICMRNAPDEYPAMVTRLGS